MLHCRAIPVGLAICLLLLALESPRPTHAQTETETPTPTASPTPAATETPTPTDAATETVTATPNLIMLATVESGQQVAIEFTVTAGEALISFQLFIVIGLILFGLLVVMIRK